MGLLFGLNWNRVQSPKNRGGNGKIPTWPDWYSVDAGQVESFDFYFDFVLAQIEGLKTLGIV